jgi:type I restriction enzyme S subunit
MSVVLLESLPADWRSIRLKWVLEALESGRREVSATDSFEDGVLSIGGEHIGYQGQWFLEKPRFVSREFFDAMSAGRIRENDILLVKDGATIGKVAIAQPLPAKHCAVNEHVFLLRVNAGNHAKYYFYVVQSSLIQDQIQLQVRGSAQPGLNSEFRNLVVLPEPPAPAQRSIAAFLDRETARIDALIEKKRRQIELLHEKRAALISHAVTKGLDPNAPMKDSGIEWLGRIPRSWRVVQFRRVIHALEQGWSPVAEEREAEADEWAVLKISAVAQGRFRASEHKALPPSLEPEARYEVRPGDLLLTRSNTPERVGDACFVRDTRHRLLMSDLIYRVHLDQRHCLHPFACYWLISRPGRAAIEADARGTSGSMVKIAQSHIRAWPILIPPLDEQSAIVQQLDHEMSRIDGIVGKIEASIDLLREYRTALISAAVTGKIDVRKEVA